MSKKAFELGKKVSLHKSYLINGRAEKKEHTKMAALHISTG